MVLETTDNSNNIQDTPKSQSNDKKIIEERGVWIKSLLANVRTKFSKVKDIGKDRRKKADKQDPYTKRKIEKNTGRINITDCLMSGLALFSMKCSSLLQFEDRREDEAIKHNLETLYNIEKVPCDTYLRERLDEVDPRELRGAFKSIFATIQRNKKLEQYVYLEEGFIFPVDASGYFSSHKINCTSCCKKHHSDGSVTYYHQIFQGAIVHPEKNIVIPFCPEPILKEDGQEKNDCELNAAKRFFEDLQREHPHLKLVVTADAIGANGPYIQAIKSHKNRSFIIVVKPSGNKSLFDFIKGAELEKYEFTKDGIKYLFEFINKVPLNDKNPDLLVNFFQYEEINLETGEIKKGSWITDITIKRNNVFKLMIGGRAKWKIENETFNTLKNQGYSFEHNFGHGNKNLTTVFATLMLLAFFIDQAQELLCIYFQNALKKVGRKIRLWEKMLELFKCFLIMSWEDFYLSIAHKYHVRPLTPNTS